MGAASTTPHGFDTFCELNHYEPVESSIFRLRYYEEGASIHILPAIRPKYVITAYAC